VAGATHEGSTEREKMAQDEYLDDDEFVDGTDLVKKLRKQLDAATKALKEQDEEMEGLRAYARESVIADILSEYEVNPAIASFMPEDIELDEESIVGWLEENAEIFGLEAVEQDGSESIDSELVSAAERMSAVEDGAIDPEIGQDLAQRIANASSPEELTQLLQG
jgi:hypothetical protein